MASSPEIHTTDAAAMFEALSKDYASLSQSFKQLERENSSLKASLPASMQEPAAVPLPKVQPTKVPAGTACLCPKCVANPNGAQCKNVDAWKNYTAWMNYSG